MTKIQNSKQVERPLDIEQVTDMFRSLVLGIWILFCSLGIVICVFVSYP
jgi:hypothetical protein